MKFASRMPLPDNMERRRTRRVEAIAYVREHPEETNRFYYVRDISESGAFLLSAKAPEVGKVINLIMNNPRNLLQSCCHPHGEGNHFPHDKGDS